MRLRPSVVALVLLLVPGVAEAQLSQRSIALAVIEAVEHLLKQADVVTAQIRGRVFDELGASIPDATVSFQPLDPRSGLTPFEAVADSRGRFDFARIRPGTYRVTCKALGYETTVTTYEVVAGVENDITVVVRRRSLTSRAPSTRPSQTAFRH